MKKLCLLLAFVCLAMPVLAGLYPSTNWMLVWHLKATVGDFRSNSTVLSDTGYIHAIVRRFDYMIADNVEHRWNKYIKTYGYADSAKPKIVFYDNLTNTSPLSGRAKVAYFYHVADSLGISHERFWLHARKNFNSSFTFNQFGTTPQSDTRMGTPNYEYNGVAIIQAGHNINDYTPSYNLWRNVFENSDSATGQTVLASTTDTLAIGYWEKWDGCYFSVATPPASGHIVKYLYLASDSTLQPLSTIDSTLTSTPKGTSTINRFQRSGWIYFQPPSDWGYKAAWKPTYSCSNDGLYKNPPLRGYWIFAVCTNTSSSSVKLKYIMKRPAIQRGFPTCIIPGWNDSLDSNADEYLDTTEVGGIATNMAAGDTSTARFKYYSRIPDFGAWTPSNPARSFINLADTLVRRVNALFVAANVDSFDGVYEDNCVPSDGSVSLSAGSPALNLADTAFIGGSGSGSNFVVQKARLFGADPGPRRFCLINEYKNASGAINTTTQMGYGSGTPTDSSKLMPGRLFHIDHLRQDSLVHMYVVKNKGKLFVGNGSQFFTDWMREGAYSYSGGSGDNSQNVHTITSTNGSIVIGGSASNLTDSAAYFAWRYHNGWEHESWNSTKNATWNAGNFPTYNVPDQWWTTGWGKGRPSFYNAGGGRRVFHPFSASSDTVGATGSFAPYNNNPVITRDRDMMSAYAAYLCFAQPDSGTGAKTYMGWRSSSDRTGAGAADPESSAFMGAVGYNMGAVAAGYDTAWVYKTAGGTSKIFVRKFANGLALFRPRPTSGSTTYNYSYANYATGVTGADTVTLTPPSGKSIHQLYWDGTTGAATLTGDTLRDGQGMVYVYSVDADVTPPTVTIIYPDGGQSVCMGDTTQVAFNTSEAGTGALFYSVDGGQSYTAITGDMWAGGVPGPPICVYIRPWMFSGVPTNRVKFKVTVTDAAGNVGSDTTTTPITVGYCARRAPHTSDNRIP